MKCPSCKNKISDDAGTCRHCYYIFKKEGTPGGNEPVECAQCGKINPSGAKFCSMCNLLFVRVQEPPPPEPKPVPEPETAPESEKAAEEIPKPAEEPAPEETPAEEPQREMPPSDEPVPCPSCEYMNPPGSKTCEMCNFILSLTPTKMAPAVIHDDPPPPPPPPPPPRRRREHREADPAKVIPLARFPQKIPFKAGDIKKSAECPNCYAQNETDASFCTMCSFVLEPVADRPKVEAQPKPVPKQKPAPEPEAKPVSEPEAKTRREPHPEPEPEIHLEAAPEPEPEPPAEPAAPAKPRKARPFVLIVEKDYALRESLTAFLESKGAQWVSDSATAQEAIIQAQSLSVEIVVADLQIGSEIFEKLRESPFLDKDMPVLFMSGLPPDQTEEKLPKDDPFIACVPKPIDEETLWKKVVELTGDTFA